MVSAFLSFAKTAFGLPKKKALDALLLLVYFSLLISYVLAFRPGHILGHFLFFIVPGFYLVWRYKNIRSHVVLVSIVFGVAVGTLLQVVAELNRVWLYEPAFPFLNLNGLPLEAILWYVIWSGFAIGVYAVFFDKRHASPDARRTVIQSNIPFLVFGALVCALTILFLFFYPSIFIINHAYIVYGIPVVIIPMLIIFYLHPKIFGEIFRAALFLSLFALMYEVIGLTVGWWNYPGSYIMAARIGGVNIPIEELILWVSLGSLTVLAWYEQIEKE